MLEKASAQNTEFVSGIPSSGLNVGHHGATSGENGSEMLVAVHNSDVHNAAEAGVYRKRASLQAAVHRLTARAADIGHDFRLAFFKVDFKAGRNKSVIDDLDSQGDFVFHFVSLSDHKENSIIREGRVVNADSGGKVLPSPVLGKRVVASFSDGDQGVVDLGVDPCGQAGIVELG